MIQPTDKRLQVYQRKGSSDKQILLDGRPLECVVSYAVKADVGEVDRIQLELYGKAEIIFGEQPNRMAGEPPDVHLWLDEAMKTAAPQDHYVITAEQIARYADRQNAALRREIASLKGTVDQQTVAIRLLRTLNGNKARRLEERDKKIEELETDRGALLRKNISLEAKIRSSDSANRPGPTGGAFVEIGPTGGATQDFYVITADEYAELQAIKQRGNAPVEIRVITDSKDRLTLVTDGRGEAQFPFKTQHDAKLSARFYRVSP